jgi:hypothetical protein
MNTTILAGLAIQVGAVLVRKGIEKILPELAKALDMPEIENVDIPELAKKTATAITQLKGGKN